MTPTTLITPVFSSRKPVSPLVCDVMLSETMLSGGSQRIVIYLGVAGISAMGIFRAVKFFTCWQESQRIRQRETEIREEENTSLRRLLIERENEANEEKRAVLSFQEEIGRIGQKLRDIETELDVARKQNQTLITQIRGMAAQNEQLEAELQKRRTEQDRMKELLEVRTRELKGAQSFLTKADHFAGGDVIKLVGELNTEILQTAATMAEELAVEEKKISAEGKEQESDERTLAITRTEEIIGPRLTDMLRMSEHHEDPILVQTAFQTGMAAYTHWMISSWCFESPEDEHMLSEIYARVREAEEQAVSGRWRQLTRTHLQRMLAHEPDLLPDLAEALANILVAAGYKDGPTIAHQRIMTLFRDRIGVVMKLAQNLNKKVGEGVTSCDLEVLYIAPDIPFQPANMNDALAPTAGADAANEKVLCTTDLGLVRAERLPGTIAHWNESVLLKPKVILPSGLAGIVES